MKSRIKKSIEIMDKRLADLKYTKKIVLPALTKQIEEYNKQVRQKT